MLRFILKHSILAIGLVPNSLAVLTAELGCVEGQKHDRHRNQKEQAAHGSNDISPEIYEKLL
jgi:hypothetical protein